MNLSSTIASGFLTLIFLFLPAKQAQKPFLFLGLAPTSLVRHGWWEEEQPNPNLRVWNEILFLSSSPSRPWVFAEYEVLVYPIPLAFRPNH